MPLNVGLEACGKSFTVIAIADESGRIISAERFPFRLNYNEMAIPNLGTDIYRLIWHVVKTFGLNVDEFYADGGRICAGISGVTTKYDRKRGSEKLWRAVGLPTANAILTGGIEIAFTGATRTLTGAAVSCHAGSVALVRTPNTLKRAGGWGPVLGDEGSAYWMGIKTLNALCRLRDGRLVGDTGLYGYVLEELDKSPAWVELLERHSKVSQQWEDSLILLAQQTKNSREFRYIVSDLAKALFKTLDQNPDDRIALSIADEAAEELLAQLAGAIYRAGVETRGLPVVLVGGIFRYQKFFRDLMCKRLRERWPNIGPVILPADPNVMRPAIGALLFSLSGSMFKLPPPEVIANVESSAKHFDALINN